MLELNELVEKIQLVISGVDSLSAKVEAQSSKTEAMHVELRELRRELDEIKLTNGDCQLSLPHLDMLSHQNKRNFLPNDDSSAQKNLINSWRAIKPNIVGYKEFMECGFRVFSQNDEDGILLRIFSQIESTNKYVVEIGSNCSGSAVGIPENLSTNLFINHGWHGVIFELDEVETSKITHFFAQNLATKHFHWMSKGVNSYSSPQIVSGRIDPENINTKMIEERVPAEPDLLVIDIDGGDFSVIKALTVARPRVLVVEFEKRFRDRFSVVQAISEDFSADWAQSGTTSLSAWVGLLAENDYTLCAISSSGFNAFFIRNDVAVGKIDPLTSSDAFDLHPVFSKLPEEFWLEPDKTWTKV